MWKWRKAWLRPYVSMAWIARGMTSASRLWQSAKYSRASWRTSFSGWTRASLIFGSGNRIVRLLALHPPLRPPAPPVWEPPPHALRGLHRVKRFGVERATPAQELLVPLVAGVGHRLQILFVAPHAAHVFRRAGPCPLDADRIPLPPLGPQAT